MDLEAIETGTATLLSYALDVSLCTVAPLPEIEAEYTQPDEKAEVWVAVLGYEAGGHKSVSAQLQYTSVRVEVVCRARRLRGNYGIYHLERLVRNTLIGKNPGGGASSGLRPMQLQANAFKDGVWSYSLFFEVSGVIMETFEEVPVGTPLITRIEFDESFPA